MIGGDVLLNDVKLKRARSMKHAVLFHQHQDEKKYSFFYLYMLLLKSGVATDPFFVGEVFYSGSIVSFIYGVLIVLITELSFYLFIKSWIYGRAYSYEKIWTELFGPSFTWIIYLLIIVTYLSFTIWQQYELYVYFSETLISIWDSVPYLLTNQWFVTYILTFLIVAPSLLVKKLSSFLPIAFLSNFCHIIGLICLIVYFSRHEHEDPVDTIMPTSDPATNFISISLFHSSVFFHPTMSLLVQDMEYPTQSRIMSLTWFTSITSFIFHFLGGFFSYLVSPENDGDVIFYYLDPLATEVIIGKIATYIISITSQMFYTYYLSRVVTEFILPNSSHDKTSTFVSGITVILLSISLNFIDEIVTVVFDLIASIAMIILVFLLPAIYYLKQYKFSSIPWGILSIILLVIGLSVGICTVVYGSSDI